MFSGYAVNRPSPRPTAVNPTDVNPTAVNPSDPGRVLVSTRALLLPFVASRSNIIPAGWWWVVDQREGRWGICLR